MLGCFRYAKSNNEEIACLDVSGQYRHQIEFKNKHI